ncbi:MAG: NAD(P)H-binding protein [Bacteroidetes bacterium]|nr:NAD(P)H-binding protein [Bacteroidota bacterium]
MRVLIFGATGLIGNLLVQECLSSTAISEVRIFVRKKINTNHPKLKQFICTYTTIDSIKNELVGDVVFNCLGTTLKVAGSKEAQYEIDCSYPVKVAKLAAANGIKTMVSVSSIGASATGNFYLKTKAEMESGVQNAIGKQSYFMRPSFLVGERKESRLGEKIGIVLFSGINYLLVGPLKKYKSIKAQYVAKAMLHIATEKPEQQIFYFADIIKRGK